MPDSSYDSTWRFGMSSGPVNQSQHGHGNADGRYYNVPVNATPAAQPGFLLPSQGAPLFQPASTWPSDQYPLSIGTEPDSAYHNNMSQQHVGLHQRTANQQHFIHRGTSQYDPLTNSFQQQPRSSMFAPRMYMPADERGGFSGFETDGSSGAYPQQSGNHSSFHARPTSQPPANDALSAPYQDSRHAYSNPFGQLGQQGFDWDESLQSTFDGLYQPVQEPQQFGEQPEASTGYHPQSEVPVAPRGRKRSLTATVDTTTAAPTMIKTKRPKLQLREFLKVKSIPDAAQAFRGSVVINQAIRGMPVYVNEATSIQAAKDRRNRATATTIYHPLGIQSDDHTTFTHQQLMPQLFQRFFDAILTPPGTPPKYITEADLEDFKRKQQIKHQACCDRMATDELQLDAMAAIELLVAAAKRLSTHGIPITSLKVSEYAKQGDKQRIMTRSDMLVDQESTFLQRVDRIIELCKICPPMALDVLNGENMEDMLAAPDMYAKRKFTNHNSNQGRNSRKKDSEQAKAFLAKMQDGGDFSGSNETPSRRSTSTNFADSDTAAGAGV